MAVLPKSCDYLVVGSGASGSVVAARLSEDPDVSVVLLEAGGTNDSLLLRLPGLGFAAANNPRFNWGFKADAAPSMENRELTWLQGRVLGGSSSINGMIYTRGHSREYDIWRQMGCEGWAFDDVLPYFKRSEANERGAGPWHGGEGPVMVRRARPELAISDAFLNAAAEDGFPILDDMNVDVVDGFGFYDINAGHGRRMSSATAYLEPAVDRPNLRILTNALALKVAIEGTKASGVEIMVGGQHHFISVKREVVLSAGAIKTPQILMLSGVGAADDLRERGLPVVHDQPNVGRNLQNHVCYRPQYLCSEPVSASRHLSPLNALAAAVRYGLFRTGPLAETYAVAGGYFRTDQALEVPDAQVVLLSALGPTKAGGATFWYRDLLPDQHGFGLTVYQGSPNSRGTVSLRSADPSDQPRIQCNYFSDPRDMPVLLKAVNRMREMMRRPAIAKYIDRELMPGETIGDDIALEADIRRNGATAYHQCGTCAMGGTENSVVAPDLKVRGIDGLRIADTSIIPRIPNAALHAPAIMIGEKAAAMIKGETR
jgi:choline dehydrogenase